MSPTLSKPIIYSREIVSPKEKYELSLFVKEKSTCQFLITAKKSPNVLGRDILGALRLNWQRIFDSFTISGNLTDFESAALEESLSEYEDVFFMN